MGSMRDARLGWAGLGWAGLNLHQSIGTACGAVLYASAFHSQRFAVSCCDSSRLSTFRKAPCRRWSCLLFDCLVGLMRSLHSAPL